MGLSDLIVDDDLEIAMDPETYQDQADLAPPLPGNYRFVVGTGGIQSRMRDGARVITDGKFPVLIVNRFKIVEPADLEREFSIFHEIRTKPFDRYGTVASDLGDITRSMDQSRGWRGLTEGLLVLDELAGNGNPFGAQIKWEAYDSAYANAKFANLGIPKGSEKAAVAAGTITKAAYDAIYKAARLGNKDFLPNGKGGLLHMVKGPSGEILTGRAKVQKFFPSNATFKLGPFPVKAKPQQLAA